MNIKFTGKNKIEVKKRKDWWAPWEAKQAYWPFHGSSNSPEFHAFYTMLAVPSSSFHENPFLQLKNRKIQTKIQNKFI